MGERCSTRELLSLFLCMQPDCSTQGDPVLFMAKYKSSCRKSIASYSLKIDQLPLQEAPNSPTLEEDMKALIIVTVLAMATSAIAVPLSRQAKAQALLAAMQDNAEMEDWLSDIGNAVAKYGPSVLKAGASAGLWDEELDREVATVQKKAEMDKAEMEGWLTDIASAVAKYGPSVLKTILTDAGDAGLLDEELDRESAVVQEDAEMEGLLRGIGKYLQKLDPAMLRDGLRLLKGGDAGVQGKDQSNNDLLVHVQQPGSRRGHAPGRKAPNPDNQEQWRTNLRRLLGNTGNNNNNNNQLNDNLDSVNTIATLKRKYHKG